jgi:hypothetical protein
LERGNLEGTIVVEERLELLYRGAETSEKTRLEGERLGCMVEDILAANGYRGVKVPAGRLVVVFGTFAAMAVGKHIEDEGMLNFQGY